MFITELAKSLSRTAAHPIRRPISRASYPRFRAAAASPTRGRVSYPGIRAAAASPIHGSRVSYPNEFWVWVDFTYLHYYTDLFKLLFFHGNSKRD
jgi:hypothetical protein